MTDIGRAVAENARRHVDTAGIDAGDVYLGRRRTYAAVQEDDGTVTIEVNGATITLTARAAQAFADEIKAVATPDSFLTQAHHSKAGA